jgi:transmembrane sensor
MPWPFVDRRERLRRQASDWIARLNGAHDERDRAAFTRWYLASADHAATYDRLMALFNVAEGARPPVHPSAGHAPATTRRQVRPAHFALAAAAIVAIALTSIMLLEVRSGPAAPVVAQAAQFTAAGNEARRIVLLDGSEVLLSPGSELEVAIGGSERRLRLRRGEGRFTVFHESRPFVVMADGTEVIARGTQFVVHMGDEGTLVSLIEGSVEVSVPSPGDQTGRRLVKLAPGQRIVVPAEGGTAITATAPAGGLVESGMIEFDDTPLAEAAEQVSRSAGAQVRLADGRLGALRVTGAFRAGDAQGFADAAAAALALRVERGRDGTLWLHGS